MRRKPTIRKSKNLKRSADKKGGVKMPKIALTVGDICKIKDILKEKQESENDSAKKAEIDGLIKKLDEMEIRS